MAIPAETITLQTVADAAGVSVSTASRALAGKAQAYRISEKTERSVKRAAETLGFRHSRIARSLRSQRTGLIGVVVPDVSNPFFSAIAKEVTIETEAHGYSVLLADSRESTEIEQRLVDQMRERQIEALVVCPVGTDSSHLRAAHESALPLVLVDRTFPEVPITQVTSDHYGGAAKAVGLLTARGHRKIGLLQGLPGTLPNNQRLQGVQDSYRDAGIKFDPSLVAGDNFTEASGYESAKQILDRHPETTALFAFSTPNAFGALCAAKEMGRRVPENLSIVSFDDSPFAEFMQVPLSTASQDVHKLGITAAKLITTQLRAGKQPRKKIHTVGVKIIRRSSIRGVHPC